MSENKDKKIQNSQYSAESIKVLEGLEAVRKRPAMYIGSTGIEGVHHLVWELIDNSVDEALAGHCDKIEVILHDDGSCSVKDNGRGIPTGIHPTQGISAAEVALTKLHAGGKFDKETYKFSGGLHGVGVSVVNALSKSLNLEIHQNGNIYTQYYERGKPLSKLEITGKINKTGTNIRFTPDPEIFKETTEFNFETLSARLRELAFLNKGLKIIIKDERTHKSHEFFFEGGIVSFVQHINAKKNPIFPEVIYAHREDEQSILEIALQYNDGYAEQIYSFVNNINTLDGGTHVSGFKAALTKASNKRGHEYNLIKNDESFSSEDVREGLVAVINLKIAEPQFEGQTKAKLGNSDVKGLVESWAFSVLDTYFEEHPALARKILQKAVVALQARLAARKAREITRRKTVLESVILPGKLADCSNESPVDSELFIVEGDSAGGSAKQARDRHSQAILPLKGKILNVEKARFDKMLSNDEIRSLISAIGSGIGNEDFNAEKARYHKIILMTDADVDGAHIRTLLLTFFYRYMKPLIEKGYLYIAQPPLYKAKIGKKEAYLKDERAFAQFLYNWAKESTQLEVDNKQIDSEQLSSLLDKVLTYQEKVERAAYTFRLSDRHTYELLEFIYTNQPLPEDMESLLNLLKKYFDKYKVELISDNNSEIPEIIFKQLNNTWTLSSSFFTNPDLNNLIKLRSELNIIDQEWLLSLVDRAKNQAGKGIIQLISAIPKLAKPYLNVQRYKGLGEMNPDQLWETAMDPKTRSLTIVTIGDAIEADNWFDTLMGSDVAGRRAFIEEFGRFVKNLDI